MTEWKYECNTCGRRNRAYKQAARELGIRIRLGPPRGDHRYLRNEYGVYIAKDQYSRVSQLTNRMFDLEREWRDDPNRVPARLFSYRVIRTPRWSAAGSTAHRKAACSDHAVGFFMMLFKAAVRRTNWRAR